MSNVYYRLYLDSVFKLAKTLVIKSSNVANAINQGLMEQGHAVSEDPYTWKYYKNLAGLYHSTDELMYVKSMDTLEEIEFTKENLDIHRATADAYIYGTRYYRDLVERHPDQEMLIMGIVNPVNLDKAVKAKDGEILHYDKELVESQEQSLIPRLQRFVDAFFTRWTNPMYVTADELYVPAQLGVLFSQLIMEIMNCRLESCKTNEAHSFHIRQYLASHGGLDRYMNYMTLKQVMFLYRNVRYLRLNAGKRDTFKTLIEEMLSARNLPIAEYQMKHKVVGLVDNLKPEVEMQRIALNDHPGDGSSDNRTVSDVLEMQLPLARNNIREIDEARVETEKRMERSRFSNLSSKVLESAIMDTTDSVPFSKEDIVINHWIYLAANDRFNTIVNVDDPVTGVTLPLSAKEACIVFFYAYNKARKIELETIPLLWARAVQKPALPDQNRLRKLVDTELVPDAYISEIRKNQPAMGVYISLSAFQEFTQELFVQKNRQRNIYAQQEDPNVKAMLESCAKYLYQDIPCDLDSGQYYTDWFDERGFEFADLGPLDLDLLASNILEEIAGGEIGVAGSLLGTLQRNMLDVMSNLTSYSVQYLQSINSTAYRIVDTAFPRVHNDSSIFKAHSFVEMGDLMPKNIGLSTGHIVNVGRKQPGQGRPSMDTADTHVTVDWDFQHTINTNVLSKNRVRLGSPTVLGFSFEESA